MKPRKAQTAIFLPSRAHRKGKGSRSESDPQKARRAIKKDGKTSRRDAAEKGLMEQVRGERTHEGTGATKCCATTRPRVMKSNR